MGQEAPKNKQQNYIQFYSQVQKEEYPFIGTVTHLVNKNSNTKHILKIFKYATNLEIAESLKRANKRKQLSQKKGSVNIVRTTQIESDRQNQLCGITNYLYIIYQDFNGSLGEIIRMRNQSRRNFTEDEILDVLRSVCCGLIFLYDNGYKNYTITKQSIMKGSKQQQNKHTIYKVLDTELAREMLPYLKILNGIAIQPGIYLAPELLQQLSNKNNDPDFSLKTEIFSLGMVALEMSCLQNLDFLYDYNKLKVDIQNIVQKVKRLNYSPYLKGILLEMLQKNEEQRVGAVSLKQKLHIGQNNKSQTQYTYSAIGNSMVTQRSHKGSYPTNNVQQIASIKSKILQQDKQQHRREGKPKFLSVQQINRGEKQIQQISFDKKGFNKTYQVNEKNKKNVEVVHRLNNFSTEKNTRPSQANQPVRTINIQNQPSTTNTITMSNKSNFNFYYPVTTPFVYQNKAPMHPQLQPQRNISYPHYQPNNITSRQSNLVTPVIKQKVQDNEMNKQRLTEIHIPDLSIQKSLPQTPINNLRDSNTFTGSDPLLSKRKMTNKSCDEENILSLNAGFKKGESSKQQTSIQDLKDLFQSPDRPRKTYVSQDSTPIRKVQALQSNQRKNFNQIINQTQEENQLQMNYNPKKIDKQFCKIGGDALPSKTYGIFNFQNGAIYEGQFDSNGSFCGNGVLYYPNKKICYSGGWLNNSFHGFGVLNNENPRQSQITNYENFNFNDPLGWHHYEGQFQMDKKNGFGTLFMVNGDKFSGCFVKDIIEGYGTFTNGQGEKISGIWNQNILRKM